MDDMMSHQAPCYSENDSSGSLLSGRNFDGLETGSTDALLTISEPAPNAPRKQSCSQDNYWPVEPTGKPSENSIKIEEIKQINPETTSTSTLKSRKRRRKDNQHLSKFSWVLPAPNPQSSPLKLDSDIRSIFTSSAITAPLPVFYQENKQNAHIRRQRRVDIHLLGKEDMSDMIEWVKSCVSKQMCQEFGVSFNQMSKRDYWLKLVNQQRHLIISCDDCVVGMFGCHSVNNLNADLIPANYKIKSRKTEALYRNLADLQWLKGADLAGTRVVRKKNCTTVNDSDSGVVHSSNSRSSNNNTSGSSSSSSSSSNADTSGKDSNSLNRLGNISSSSSSNISSSGSSSNKCPQYTAAVVSTGTTGTTGAPTTSTGTSTEPTEPTDPTELARTSCGSHEHYHHDYHHDRDHRGVMLFAIRHILHRMVAMQPQLYGFIATINTDMDHEKSRRLARSFGMVDLEATFRASYERCERTTFAIFRHNIPTPIPDVLEE
mmetsp:Transcript_14436/g.23967  ORF Transcript_14436/g.23967 Transcript_14436/m.23967 type:complete len:489 (+) Transcript_14436:26-1492(+)